MTEYTTALNPKGYVNNREITNLDGQYLVKGSKNTLIFNNERVDSRKGMTRITPVKTKNKGTWASYDWYSSNGKWRNVSINDKQLSVYWKGNLVSFKALENNIGNFYPWWDSAETLDLLLFVNGTDKIYSWSGGITEVASVTSNTITKKKYITGTTYAFVDNGASLDTITDSSNGFIAAGFEVGGSITVSGTLSNDGVYTIHSVTAGVIEVSEEDELTNEPAGVSCTIRDTKEGTWGQSRFLLNGTRKVYIDGAEYEYTGGEGTGTLTGVTPDPSAGGVVAGDIALQAVTEYTPAELAGMNIDLVSVINNYTFFGSTISRNVLMSKNTDFADYAFSSPLRLVGEGFDFIFDSSPTAFVPNEDEMWISAGFDDWYKISFELTSDHSGESVRIKKFKTSTAQAAINQSCIIKGKNGVTFLSQDKTFDFLGKVNAETGYNVRPISDPIKEDMIAYNTKNASGIYFKRDTYLILPEENVLLIFDNESGYWQPPQTFALSRLALIDVNHDGELALCGYSNNSNEIYKLFDGYSDNGLSYKCVAAFGYDNFGKRFTLKNFDEAATELYISKNTVVTRRILLDYLGSTEEQVHTIDGNDDAITFGIDGSGALGINPLGISPLGSSLDEIESYRKARIIHTVPAQDFFERQNIFESESDAVRFSILAYAENVYMSENEPTFIRK